MAPYDPGDVELDVDPDYSTHSPSQGDIPSQPSWGEDMTDKETTTVTADAIGWHSQSVRDFIAETNIGTRR